MIMRSEEVESRSDKDKSLDLVFKLPPAGQQQADPASHGAADKHGGSITVFNQHCGGILHPILELHIFHRTLRVPDACWVVADKGPAKVGAVVFQVSYFFPIFPRQES